MNIAVIQQKLLTYQCQTILEEENALKEIIQEIALMALSRAGFFREAAFLGGTCLRILYGLERFSEDLDFSLQVSNKNFVWSKYVNHLSTEFGAYGFSLEIKDREQLEKSVKIAFLKANSIGNMLVLKDARTNKPKLRIKLEIDTSPPEGAQYELKYLDFPLPYSVKTLDLPSLFAGKCHALLCRDYIKGRDWFDFIWYVTRQTSINFTLLTHAIAQIGPWQKQNISVIPQWFLHQLKTKITHIDWDAAKQDVASFLKPRELSTLTLWSQDFFLSRLEKLSGYLKQK